jgi:hypothetical protein
MLFLPNTSAWKAHMTAQGLNAPAWKARILSVANRDDPHV